MPLQLLFILSRLHYNVLITKPEGVMGMVTETKVRYFLTLAEELHFGATHPDEDEFLEPLRVPFDEAVRQCMDGTLTDAKTVAAILKGKILRAQ